MDITILNKSIAHTPEIEHIVNGVVALAIEQGVTPETDVDVDHPLTLGEFEIAEMDAEQKAETKPDIKPKNDGPDLV